MCERGTLWITNNTPFIQEISQHFRSSVPETGDKVQTYIFIIPQSNTINLIYKGRKLDNETNFLSQVPKTLPKIFLEVAFPRSFLKISFRNYLASGVTILQFLLCYSKNREQIMRYIKKDFLYCVYMLLSWKLKLDVMNYCWYLDYMYFWKPYTIKHLVYNLLIVKCELAIPYL